MAAGNNRWKYFLFSLGGTLVVLTVALILFVFLSGPKAPQTTQADVPKQGVPYIPKTDENLCFLLVLHEGEEYDFYLMKFDYLRGRVPVIRLPGETGILQEKRYYTMEEYYKDSGVEGLKNCLNESFSIQVDRQITLDREQFIRVSDALGKVEVELTEEMEMKENGRSTKLSPGRQLFDGKQLFYFLTTGAEQGAENFSTELLCSALNQKLEKFNLSSSDHTFRQIINEMQTDLSYRDYESRREPMEFLQQLVETPASPITCTGNFDGSGRYLFLTETTKQSLKESF